MKTVAFCFVVFALAPISFATAQPVEVAPGVLQLGTIQNPQIVEGSGLISSRRARGFFWTHNDGGAATLFSIAADGGGTTGYPVENVELQDWEDVALAGGRLYIADIGNNTGSRNRVDVYAVAEPNPRRPREVRSIKRWTLDYPGQPFDAESFFISRGHGYVIEKESGNAHVYRFKLSGKAEADLDEQCELNVGAPVAGADITSDSRRLAVITREGAYLFMLKGKVPADGTLDPALFVPFSHEQMEGCCFTRNGLLVTAEDGGVYLFTAPQFQLRSGARVLP
ncbi:MAG TPA: hypothetical protein VNT99_12625 [Methylomirabilota bacterium]|nr:hypothetical protein [Methylomirabilota bacterium]